MGFAGWAALQGPWPKTKYTLPGVQCWPLKGTDGRETTARLERGMSSPGLSFMLMRWLVFFPSLFISFAFFFFGF